MPHVPPKQTCTSGRMLTNHQFMAPTDQFEAPKSCNIEQKHTPYGCKIAAHAPVQTATDEVYAPNLFQPTTNSNPQGYQ
eukprot:7118328-Ditylum_brightwellii.AAC.1